MPVEFSTPTDTEVRISDALQHRQFVLDSFDPIEAERPATDPFATDDSGGTRVIDFAVEDSRVVETSGFLVPKRVVTFVRSLDGDLLAQPTAADTRSFSHDSYVVEFNGTMKVFLRFEGAFDIVSESTESRIFFDGPLEVYVGGRSIQNTTKETHTVSRDITDVYRVLSHLGASLATHSPERSWSTLRSHPAHVTLGPDCTLPERTPESGVTLRVPRDREFLYAAAPIAYYLDATVVPDTDAALETTAGYRASLPDESAPEFSRAVHDVLQHQFTLDALTRTVGFYNVPLVAREVFERKHGELPWRELYDSTLAERVAAYADVPREATRAVQPTWRTTATMSADPEHVRSLPYLVNELALIQPLYSTDSSDVVSESAAVSSFLRSPSSSTNRSERRYVSPPPTDTLEDVWVGEGVPVNASKYLPAAHGPDQDHATSTKDITIQVVCNDEEMRHEVEEELYGGREALPFDVSTAFDTSVSELRELLSKETDFFHYIGHLDGRYFYCPDGRLDPMSLDDVGVRGFLLNGCESYDQGRDLVRAGATGGIVTLSRVADGSASRVGVMLARLLDQGFSLRAALAIAREHQGVGSQYVGIGNTSISLVQSEAGMPAVAHIQRADENAFSAAMCAYPTNAVGMGALYRPYLGRLSKSFISGGFTAPVRVTQAELLEFLKQDYLLPTVFENEFLWSPALVERLS